MSVKENLKKIFLRPSEKNTPVKYLSSPEQVGLILSPKDHLGIFTSRSTANTGPPGPPGEDGADGVDQNSWFDVILASASDETSSLTVGGPKTTYRCPFPLKMDTPGYEGYVRASLSLAPVGSPVIVDVRVNGVSMFSTKIQIDAGEKTSVTSVQQSVLSIGTIPDDAEFEIYVDAVGSTFGGAGLKIAVTGIKTD